MKGLHFKTLNIIAHF